MTSSRRAKQKKANFIYLIKSYLDKGTAYNSLLEHLRPVFLHPSPQEDQTSSRFATHLCHIHSTGPIIQIYWTHAEASCVVHRHCRHKAGRALCTKVEL